MISANLSVYLFNNLYSSNLTIQRSHRSMTSPRSMWVSWCVFMDLVIVAIFTFLSTTIFSIGIIRGSSPPIFHYHHHPEKHRCPQYHRDIPSFLVQLQPIHNRKSWEKYLRYQLGIKFHTHCGTVVANLPLSQYLSAYLLVDFSWI